MQKKQHKEFTLKRGEGERWFDLVYDSEVTICTKETFKEFDLPLNIKEIVVCVSEAKPKHRQWIELVYEGGCYKAIGYSTRHYLLYDTKYFLLREFPGVRTLYAWIQY